MIRRSASASATEIRRRRVQSGVLLAALVLLLTACGDEADPPAPAPDQADGFAAAADELCSNAQAEQEQVRRELGGEQITLDDRARLLVDLGPSRVALGEDLAALEPPPGGVTDADRLVAAAERRGVASTRAGELWEQGASRVRIASAAAAEHDERERFVAIAGRLGLLDCAEVLSGTDRREVERAVEAALGALSAGERCDALSERYRKERYGDLAGCLQAERGAAPAESVIVADPEGIDDVFALAGANSVGGVAPGTSRIRLTYEGGRYRVDKVD